MKYPLPITTESEEQKVNDYIMEMTMDLSDEEFMLRVHNRMLQTKRKIIKRRMT